MCSLFPLMMRSWKSGKLIASLQTLIKSHKAPGEVTFRAVHSMPSFCGEGLCRWLVGYLRGRLAGLQHLARDSRDIVNLFGTLDHCPEMRLSKFDVKDFYLQGSHVQIQQAAVSGAEPAMKPVLEEVLWYLLDGQFVRSRFLPGRLWKVKKGTGIGLLHSGELTDWIFYVLVEKPLFESGLLSECGVLEWWRYKDDILILSKGHLNAAPLIKHMTSRGNPWQFKVEDINAKSMHYLDIRISIGRTFFTIHPEYKSSALLLYLSHESGHHGRIHRAWPRMMMSRVASRCLNVDSNDHQSILAERFRGAGMAPAIINDVMKRVSGAQRIPRCGPMPKRSFWLVLPFHPSWARSISQAVRCLSKADLQVLLSMSFKPWSNFSVRVSWSNALEPFVNLLLR